MTTSYAGSERRNKNINLLNLGGNENEKPAIFVIGLACSGEGTSESNALCALALLSHFDAQVKYLCVTFRPAVLIPPHLGCKKIICGPFAGFNN